MKKIIAASMTYVLAAVTALTVGFSASNANANPDVPIPLDFPVPFPWNSIEGLWEAKGPGFRWLFSFEVQNDASIGKILKVVHIDTMTREVVSMGTALAVQNSFEVAGAMVADGYNYQLFVGLYRTEDKPNASKVVVLTLRRFSQPESADTKLIINKIAPVPVQAPKHLGKSEDELHTTLDPKSDTKGSLGTLPSPMRRWR